MNIYIAISIICSFCTTYTLYRYYKLFFAPSHLSAIAEKLCYFILFLINISAYLIINIPLVTLLSNIATRFLITYLYPGKLRHRIFLSLSFCIIATLFETAVFFLFIHTPIHIGLTNQQSLIQSSAPIFSTVFLYLFVLIFGRIKKQNPQIKLPLAHWLLLLVIPLVSFYLILLIMSFEDADPKTVALCCILALIINFVAFYFYEVVTAYAISKMEKQREEEKNRYYLRQLETMETFSESMRSFRHDLKNHTIAMQAYLKNKQYDALEAYLSNTFIEEALSEENIHCGNTVVDSILNFKIHEAGNKGITLEAKVSIPPQLHISDSDLTVILGNLLDNAIEAVEPLTEERVIQLTISYQKGNLILSVKNPYKGELLKKGDRWITSKKDKDLHGYGLSNVKHVVDKNGGTMRIQTEQQIFSVTMMLYDTNTDESH